MSQRRRSIGFLKAHDIITSPAYIVIKAAEKFKDQATAPNQLWQTDFTYLKITGWGWYYLSTVLDDFSRFIVAWKLCATMKRRTSPPRSIWRWRFWCEAWVWRILSNEFTPR